ncbi:translation initiation factor 2 [Cellulomonas sp. McL0617]|uniref:translation initiation factor 2 n=1 Tax=Cellulomonas sp. McL0617 TaxID=3415675 RepID=UPI003CE943F1
MSDKDAHSRLAEARRVATQELFKQGTPDYDPRAHQRAVEAQHKAQVALDSERAAEHPDAD